jgi:hypothetical protein
MNTLPPQREVICPMTPKLQAGTIWISATTGIPVGSLVVPPLLTGVQAGQCLQEDPYDRPFLILR